MDQPRVDALVARLEKGRRRTDETLRALTPEQWERMIYDQPRWTPRDLLAHFVSSEENLLVLAREVAAGGSGAPEDFGIDVFNAREQARLAAESSETLLSRLDEARRRTIAWVSTLDGSDLDKSGRHPGLGIVSLETMILAVYGHQLLHIRDLGARLAHAGTP